MPYDPYDRGDNPWRGDLDSLDMPKGRPKARPGAGRMPLTLPAPVGPPSPLQAGALGMPMPPPRPPGLEASLPGGMVMPPPRPKMTAAPVPMPGPPMPTASDEPKADRDFGSTPGPTAGMLAPGPPPGGPPPGGPPPTALAGGGMAELMKLLAGMGGGMRGVG